MPAAVRSTTLAATGAPRPPILASVRSLAKRSPARKCCARVVAVHMAVFFQLGLDNPLESHLFVATQP